MTLNIAILGTSGHVGTATVRALSSRVTEGVSVTAFVRDPSGDKAKDIASLPNIHLKAGDMGDEANTTQILQGFDVVYIISPGHIDRTKLTQTAVHAAKAAGVKHLVVVSVLNADVQHHIFGRQFTPVEETVKATGIPYTLLRLPIFLDNNYAHVGSIKGQGHIYSPQDPDALFASIAVQDVGLASALVLLDPSKHVNKTYALVNKLFTNAELTAAFTKFVGKEIQYIRVDYPTAKQAFMSMGIQEWQTDGILELFKGIDDKLPVLSTQNDDFKSITGQDPLTVEQWAEIAAPAFK